MAAQAALSLTGVKALDRTLATLSVKMQTKLLKKAVRVSAKPIVDKAKQIVGGAAERFGFLRRSLGVRLRTYPSGNTVAIIGARGPRRRTRGKITSASVGDFAFEGPDGRIHVPAFYAHHVELGTVFQGAQPFLRPAFESRKAEAKARFQSKAAEDIEKQATIIAAVAAKLATLPAALG